MKVAIVCPDYPPTRGGLADHTAGLAHILAGWASVEVFTSSSKMRGVSGSPGRGSPAVPVRREIGRWDFREMGRLVGAIRAGSFDWMIVQYVPHMYSRLGFNFALPYAIWRARNAGVRVLLLVHELYLDWSIRLRRLAASAAQRLMLRCCVEGSNRVAVSTEVWLNHFRSAGEGGQDKFCHLPSPSNFERETSTLGPSESPVEDRRERAGILLGFFGTWHDSKLPGHLAAALRGLREKGMDARLLCVGPAEADLHPLLNGGGGDLRAYVDCTGYLEPDDVIHRLRGVDIFLLPLTDGLSSRRSSLMTALSLGLPVVGTEGPLTDHSLRRAGICRWARVEDVRAFADEVLRLAQDPQLARDLGQRARAFYRREYSWDAAGQRLRQVLTVPHE